MGIVLALTIVLGLGVTWQVRSVMQRVFISELENRGISVAGDLAARSVDPILLNDTYALYQLLTETVANHPDTLYAFVIDSSDHVLAHTFGDSGFPVALHSGNLQFTHDGQIGFYQPHRTHAAGAGGGVLE